MRIPVVLFAITMGTGWLLGVVVPLELPLSFVARLASGGAFLAAGALLGFLALGQMRCANTTAEPNSTPAALVTRGPFRFSRNPIYIAAEERMLAAQFPDAYAAYRRSVRRWL